MKLGVNIDHVATIRQARHTDYPDPLRAALLAQENGADQITFHLREDRRHIQDDDLPRLKTQVKIPLNLEMATNPEMIDIALALKPYSVTLVPERRQELTTEGGLDLKRNFAALSKCIPQFKLEKIKVSLFIDPDLAMTEHALALGADHVEFHTGTYCDAKTNTAIYFELNRLQAASRYANENGLYVAAGHGIHYGNLLPLLEIKEIVEYNIGHSIVAESMFVGFGPAVRRMKDLLNGIN